MTEVSTLVIVNPLARGGELGARWEELKGGLCEALGDQQVRITFTSEKDHGSGVVRSALAEGIKKIVVVGGDGTVSEVIQGFSLDASLVIMPAGRGDDFFKSLTGRVFHSAKDAWDFGLSILKRGHPYLCDLGRVKFLSEDGSSIQRLFINVASFGYPGLVVQRVHSRSGFLGKSQLAKKSWTYLLNTLSGLKDYIPVDVKVNVDGNGIFNGPIFSGFVLNGAYNAGGICWSKDAKINDGLFHIVLFEPRGILPSLLSSPNLFTGKWEGVKGVHVVSGKSIEIQCKNPRTRSHPLFEIDGDQPEPVVTIGAEINVVPKAIQIWRM